MDPLTPTTLPSATGYTLERLPVAAASSTPIAASTAESAANLNPSANLPGAQFKAALRATQAPAHTTVQRGDTLIGLIRHQLNQNGQTVSDHQAFKLAHQVAQENGIANPNRIYPGQRVSFSTVVDNAPTALAQTTNRAAALATTGSAKTAVRATSTAATANAQLQSRAAARGYPVLEQTLQRAVDKGFIRASEKPQVYGRILQLAHAYRFAPDDFARLALMESDGLNPRASNGRCHGIIQFCEGPDRGAASVGYAGRAGAIRGLNVMAQLDLVERYFQDAGLAQDDKPVSLDDLYLTVLTPNARTEQSWHAPLNIPGAQAADLHVAGDRRRPITRASIVNGLVRNTLERLGIPAQTPTTPEQSAAIIAPTDRIATGRQKVAAYEPTVDSAASASSPRRVAYLGGIPESPAPTVATPARSRASSGNPAPHLTRNPGVSKPG